MFWALARLKRGQHLQLVRFLMLALLPLMWACEKRDPSMISDPYALVKAVLEARNKGDVGKYLSLVPSDALLSQILNCWPKDELLGQIQRFREDAPLALLLRREAGHYSEVKHYDEKDTQSVELLKGDMWKGCALLAPIEAKKLDLTLENRLKGEKRLVKESFSLMRPLGDSRWYWLPF